VTAEAAQEEGERAQPEESPGEVRPEEGGMGESQSPGDDGSAGGEEEEVVEEPSAAGAQEHL
jgi:hypothetical protein